VFLEKQLPANWEERDLDQRLLFYGGGFGEPETGTEERIKVCALEIWRECFRENRPMTQADTRRINSVLRKISGWESAKEIRSKLYGKQRGFLKKKDGTSEKK